MPHPLLYRFSILLLLLSPVAARADDCLLLAFPAESPNFKLRQELAQMIYQEAGLCAAVKDVPTGRIPMMLEQGSIDGEVLRVDSYLDRTPTLIRIPTALTSLVGRLYWLDGRPRPTGNGQMIGFPRGWAWPRRAAEPLKVTALEVSTSSQLFEMCLAGRIEGFLLAEYDFRGLEAAGVDTRPFTSIPVWQESMHHAVTRAHADLVPRLDAAIQRLAAKGVLSKLLTTETGD